MPEPRLAHMPRNLIDAMQAAGLDTGALARRLGLTAEGLESGLTYEEMDRFSCAAWEELADPAFGLKAGAVGKRAERFGVVGFAAMTSPTLEVALARLVRYIRLVWGDPHVMERGEDAATVRLIASGPERPYTQSKLDFELASLLTVARKFTGQPVRPLRVGIRGPVPAPAYRALYAEIFDCPLRFDQAEHSIALGQSDLERRLISANADVANLFERCAETELAQWQDSDIASRVRAALRGMLRGDEPTLAAVAAALHLSTRTLQRRLSEDGVNFRELLDDARRELAVEYLRSGLASLMEISYLLGFADPNSFFRAFKRWTGTTPEVYRSRLDSRRGSVASGKD